MGFQFGKKPKKGWARVLAFSDWRTQDYLDLERFARVVPDVDLLIYAGDDLDRLLAARQIIERVVSKTSENKLLFVAGNDDLPQDKRELSSLPFTHDLDVAPFVYKHLAFIGIDGAVDGIGFTIKTEEDVRKKLRSHQSKLKRFKSKKDPVLFCVSHSPPAGVLDSAIRYSPDGLARHIGSKELLGFLTKNRVLVTVCGHVHLFGGRSEQLANGNTVINIASHDSRDSHGNFAVIDISKSGSMEIAIDNTHAFYRESDLSLLTELGFSRFKKLQEQDINCCADLSTDPNAEKLSKIKLAGISTNLFCKWLAQIELLKEGTPAMRVFNPQKFEFLKHPHLIVWDIETDLAQRQVWLIGAYDLRTGEKRQFFNPDNEGECLAEFAAWMKTKPEARTVSYSGSRMDARVVIKSAEKHNLEADLNFLNDDIDLCPAIRYGTANTYASLGLKELAATLGYNFKHPDIDGFHVGHVFTDYIITGEAPEDWQKYLDYNLDDVMATAHLIEHIRSAGKQS